MASARELEADYLPIAEHGLVGDLHTVALVGTNGTIDWYCCPAFDAPSVFGAILDKDKGGFYALRPTAEDWTAKQLYFPDTNVLITRFFTEDGVGEVQDFMPIEGVATAEHRHRLVRRVVVVRGQMDFKIEVQPRFDYGRAEHEVEMHPHGVLFRSPDLTLALEGAIARTMGHERRLERRGGGIYATFSLAAGDSQTFVLERVPQDHICRPYSERETLAAFEATVAYWRKWVGQSRYTGRWREMVLRSALTLKLLTYAPTGALVAAPTTSLPEQLGGHRNWDYRYTWIRDAAFSLYGLLRLGFTEEAAAFMGWLTDRTREWKVGPSGPLQIMYGIDGRAELPEEELDQLGGLPRLASPVRIGNAAAEQRQLDIYGELIDSVYLFNKYGSPIFSDTWDNVRRIVDWLCENWDQADEGIWETRGGQKDFTYSRLMSLGRARARDPHEPRARPAGRHRALARRARPDLQPDHAEGLEQRAPGVRAALRLRRARRVGAADAADAVHRAAATRAGCRRSTRSATSWSPTRWSTATTSRRRPTACAATRARSRCARSGTSRRSRARGGSTRRGWRSRRCSPTPTTSGSTRRRSGRRARRWATSRRPSPTWR